MLCAPGDYFEIMDFVDAVLGERDSLSPRTKSPQRGSKTASEATCSNASFCPHRNPFGGCLPGAAAAVAGSEADWAGGVLLPAE